MNVPPPSGAPDPAAARIAASADAWKRKLLDLTKRNRAIHFRPNRVSTVAFVGEAPADLFRILHLRERAMRFKAAPDAGADAPPPGDAGARDEDDIAPYDMAPYDPASLDERRSDDWLQTDAAPDALDKSLRRLDEQARLSTEEQGVNTLFLALGMLRYTESESSNEEFRAPLVLLPVVLSRKSARSAYSLRAGDEDPMVNPALAELLRREHGIALPELPDPSAIADDYDLQTLFASVAAATLPRPGWSLEPSVWLSLFSFQKFAMYKDLEANAAALAAHRLVRQLVLRRGDERSGAVVGLPAEIRGMDLDRDFAPEATYQVVDADSSQLRAIAAADRGHDLVIEGPPGTGKSQTITNLIAQALAAGKSVLFVAEKMAALAVVHDRLVRAGLGECCLELHSTKASKRAVMQQFAAALDASLEKVSAPTVASQRLPGARQTLTEYVAAVHTPDEPMGVSPWHAYGQLGKVLGAPRVPFPAQALGGATPDLLDRAQRDIAAIAAAARDVGVPAQHPWRETTRTLYTVADLETVEGAVRDLLRRLEDVTRAAAAVEAELGLPAVRTFADVDAVVSIAGVMARSPGAPVAVLGSAAWNAPPAEALALIERGRTLSALEAKVLGSVRPAALDEDHGDDVAYVERKSAGFLGFLAFLDGRWRAIRGRWLSLRRDDYTGSMLDQAGVLRSADRVRAERRDLDAATPAARGLFGDLWLGPRSDWDALAAYVAWVVEFRRLCVGHSLSGKAIAVAAGRSPDMSRVETLKSASAAARAALDAVRTQVGWPAGHLAAEPISTVIDRAKALVENIDLAPRWAAFEQARQGVAASLARDALPAAMEGNVAFADLADAFVRAFWVAWLSAVVHERPALERFHTLTHEQRVAEFRELDRRVLVENRARLVGQIRSRLQERLQAPELAEPMATLRGEMRRQRGLAPLRRTMRAAGPAIRAIKPCLMMSPLTVAQLLDGGSPAFDLAIFDEASQLPPEDAVGAILRTRQLVVVGDPKQLPPTNFFAIAGGVLDTTVAEDGTPLYEDSESILEQFAGAGFPPSRLRWHYRSAHESLITFSNVQFYGSDLFTFPSVERGTATTGLQFEHVPDGVYEGKGLNAAEARRVAEAVVEFARDELVRRAAGEAPRSLGVGTFNLRQQLGIQDELERRRRDDPSIEPFFDRAAAEPFFVKNLENIQGDERDVVFLSVTYARAADGKLRYNFGPLNGENGWRRLNVLTTRARRRMRVFSSMRADEISPTGTTARGALLLREFLLYAERGRLDGTSASLASATESPFEHEVMTELANRGISAVPQVGAAGYRIDLGVVDESAPGRFVCGVECDGVAYHSSETARDRDRLRQQVLEDRGWTIVRVWSTDWFKDRRGQIERLCGLIEDARQRSRDEEATRRAEAERAAEAARRREAEAEETARLAAASVVSMPAVAYERKAAVPYVVTPGAGRFASDILAVPVSQVVQAVVSVVETEGPVHATDVSTRVAGMWGSRTGSRIQARIDEAVGRAVEGRLIQRRETFLWSAAGTCVVRSRAGTRIPGDRIAPEEVTRAIEIVLAAGHGFSRAQLTTEVRALFGYARTGATLDECIGSVIDSLLAAGRLGEASVGIRLRG